MFSLLFYDLGCFIDNYLRESLENVLDKFAKTFKILQQKVSSKNHFYFFFKLILQYFSSTAPVDHKACIYETRNLYHACICNLYRTLQLLYMAKHLVLRICTATMYMQFLFSFLSYMRPVETGFYLLSKKVYETSFILMKVILYGYLISNLDNCAMKLCTEAA